MKIGLISGEYAPMPGGVGDFTRILAMRIADNGHQVSILSRDGCHSERLPLTTVSEWGWRCLAQIRRWADQVDLDIVNLQFQTAAYDMSPFVHFLASALDQPIVTTFHDLRYPYLFPKAGFLRDWIVMELAQSSDGVIATNGQDAAQLAHLPQLATIPVGSAIDVVAEHSFSRRNLRERFGADESTFLLGHFGFVTSSKGIDTLVEALAELRQHDPPIRLVLIGAQANPVDKSDEADHLERMRARILELGLHDQIHWTGYLPDAEVSACLQSVDLVVLPYRDGASFRRTSLLAAVQHGCAILSTAAQSATETLIHGENMWLVQDPTSSALADSITRLSQDRQLLEPLRQGAKALGQRFDWDAIAAETVAFYERVLSATGHLEIEGRQPAHV